MPIQNSLKGVNAFYNQPDYLEKTKKDFSQTNFLPTSTYTWNTGKPENTMCRVLKIIVSIIAFPIFFPIIAYRAIHNLMGLVVMPASILYGKKEATVFRENIFLEGDWKYKPLTIEVDGYKIDAVIFGKPTTLDNGRWVLASNGNAELYEVKLSKSREFTQILSKINGNGIVFNYPGVGASGGITPSRESIAKAYRAMLRFLEDKENGIGAKEIIGYGHSIGGAAQGDALKTHELKADIKYVFIKSRTFSDLSTEVSYIINRMIAFLIRIFGWNMDSVVSSTKLKASEIIMQTANRNGTVINDGIIPAEASLYNALKKNEKDHQGKKIFMPILEDHNSTLNEETIDELAKHIELALK